MRVILERLSSQPVRIGLNNKFLEFYEKLPFREKKQRYENKLETDVFSLKLLDGKYGNFCYCPEEFLAVSVGKSLSGDHSIRGIYIHLYKNINGYWDSSLRIEILFNYDHERDSMEKSSSALARSAIKKVASCSTHEEAYRYLMKLLESRREFC